MTANSVMELLPDNRARSEKFASLLIGAAKDGEVNPLKLYVQLKYAIESLEAAKEAILENALNERDKYPEKKLDLFGCVIEKVEAGSKYDFSTCNDGTYMCILDKFGAVQKEKKEREDYLKKIPQGASILIEETGEVIQAPVKSSKTTLKIS